MLGTFRGSGNSKVMWVIMGLLMLGLTGFGSFAEKVATDAMRVLPMPADMDFVTAAGFSMT